MSEVITIDGPTSSGKSTIGFLLAQRLGYQFIDTGSIYRAGSILALEQKIPLTDSARIAGLFIDMDIKFKAENGRHMTFLNGKEVTDILHAKEVTAAVPIVAAIPQVRVNAKIIQRQVGERENTVMMGRDIGSEIFPDAKLKFYINASAQVRAKRRFNQLKKVRPELTYDEVLTEIADRDLKDSTRDASPLRVPEGAIIIDSTDLNIEETLEAILAQLKP